MWLVVLDMPSVRKLIKRDTRMTILIQGTGCWESTTIILYAYSSKNKKWRVHLEHFVHVTQL